jgi:hypothetical protein
MDADALRAFLAARGLADPSSAGGVLADASTVAGLLGMPPSSTSAEVQARLATAPTESHEAFMAKRFPQTVRAGLLSGLVTGFPWPSGEEPVVDQSRRPSSQVGRMKPRPGWQSNPKRVQVTSPGGATTTRSLLGGTTRAEGLGY